MLDSIMANARYVLVEVEWKTFSFCSYSAPNNINYIEHEVCVCACWLSTLLDLLNFKDKISFHINSIPFYAFAVLFLYRTNSFYALSFSMDTNTINWSRWWLTIQFVFISLLLLFSFHSIHCIDPIKSSYWWHFYDTRVEWKQWTEEQYFYPNLIHFNINFKW